MFRTAQLLQAALAAEGLRLRCLVRSARITAGLAGVAMVFGLATLCLAHVTGFFALERYAHLEPLLASAALLAIDAILTLLFLLLMRYVPSKATAEAARELRNEALREVVRPGLAQQIAMLGLQTGIAFYAGRPRKPATAAARSD